MSTPAAAQGGVELGIDGKLSRTEFDGFGLTTVAVPVSRVRAGFYMSETVALEPRVALNYLDSEGESLTLMELGAGLFYHFKADRAMTRPYLGATASMAYADVSDLDSETDFSLGAEGGLKIPMADRMDFRLGAFVQRFFDAESTEFGVLFGISFFTR